MTKRERARLERALGAPHHMRPQNIVARSLADKAFAHKVVPSAKVYKRVKLNRCRYATVEA